MLGPSAPLPLLGSECRPPKRGARPDTIPTPTFIPAAVTPYVGMSAVASKRRIAIFFLPVGLLGRERLLLAITRQALADGHSVDLLTPSSAAWLRSALPSGANLIDLSGWWMGPERQHARAKRRTYLAVPTLARYLRRARPDVLLAASVPPGIAAILAQRLSGVATRMVIRQSDPLRVPGHPDYDGILERRRDRWIPTLWPDAAGIIAVSEGVAETVRLATDLPARRVRAVPNAVDLTEIADAAAKPSDHPWFANGAPPVIVNVGRLAPQKDQATLIRAFARVRADRPVRLVIFGQDMGQGEALRAFADDLGVGGDVDLVGFHNNPYSHMAQASLFVLSSIREGMCNALIEALACGCPTVSTDCPCGAREVLDDGRHGALVPVGDDEALAVAMLRTLDAPPEAATLEAHAGTFAVERAVKAYLDTLLCVAAGDTVGTGLESATPPTPTA